MDWSEKDLCIKCNEGGNLLVCSENGCPLAVHEGCMGCPARFDDAGSFYCPYCLYKQAVGEARRARDYVLARKKALLLFMDDKTIGSEQHIEENQRAEGNGHNESKFSEANVKIISCNDGKTKSISDAICNQPIQLDGEQNTSNAVEENINNIEEEKIQEEGSEASAGSEGHDQSLELLEEQRISEDEEKQNHEEGHENQEEGQENQEEEHENQVEDQDNQEEKHGTSAASGGEDNSHKMHKHKVSDNEDKTIQEEQGETTSHSTSEGPSHNLHASAKRVSKRRKPVDRDSDAVSVPSKLRKQQSKNKQISPIVDSLRRSSRRLSSAPEIEKVLNKVVCASKSSKKSEQSPVKLASDAFGGGKRKRLLWREEEEEHLKEGVAKYAIEANKNIPWRKILDTGKFDPSRTPSDLKDKWRNMIAKYEK